MCAGSKMRFMNPLILFLSLAVPTTLAAQELSVKQDAKGWYRTTREFQEAGVVGRKSFPFEPPSDDKGKFLYCAIAPGADWVLDSQEEHVEEQYLKLVARALNLDARSSREQNTGVVGFCGRLRSPTPIGDLERIDATWRGACQYSKAAPHLGRYTCTAVSGGTVYPPGGVVVQTLKALARSPHAKTAMTALRLMEEIRGRDKFFAKTVSEVLRDIKTPSAARERAAEIPELLT